MCETEEQWLNEWLIYLKKTHDEVRKARHGNQLKAVQINDYTYVWFQIGIEDEMENEIQEIEKRLLDLKRTNHKTDVA